MEQSRASPVLVHHAELALVSYLVIIQLIANTTTDTGLTVDCRLDENHYEKVLKISDAEMATLNIKPAAFHGEWNYTISPRPPDG